MASNDRRGSQDNVRRRNYGDFTSLEIAPDYERQDNRFGRHGNEFASRYGGPGAAVGRGGFGGDGGRPVGLDDPRTDPRSLREGYSGVVSGAGYGRGDELGQYSRPGMYNSNNNDNNWRHLDYNNDNGGNMDRRGDRNHSRLDATSLAANGRGLVNTGFQGDDEWGEGDAPHGRTAMDVLEMRRMQSLGRSDGSAGDYHYERSPRLGGHHLRRAKSMHRNGYEYFHMHRRNLSDAAAPDETEPNPDYRLDDPLEYTVGDMKKTWQYLKTLKVRRKTKRTHHDAGEEDVLAASARGDGGEAGVAGIGLGAKAVADRGDGGSSVGVDDLTESSFEEEVGLPSTNFRTKGLAEKMMLARQLDSAAEVARQYERNRDSIWEVKRRSVKSRKKGSVFKRAGRSASDLYRAAWYKLSFWSSHFKEIEGRCGIATTTYFRFTRWLVKINLLVFLIFLCCLYVPQFMTWAEPSKNIFIEETPINVTRDHTGLFQSVSCSSVYGKYVENISDYTGIPVVLDIVKGTGLLEDTAIFYGRYSNLSFTYSYNATSDGSQVKVSTDLNMGLVYMLVMIGSFLIIFVMIVKTSSKSVKQTIMDLDNTAIASYSNSIFAGWDYCIDSEKTATYKQNIIYNDLQAKLEEIRIKRKQKLRTRQEKLKLFAKRFVINVLVLCILGGCFYTIVIVTNFLLEKQDEDLGEVESLVVEFLPSIVISGINFLIPLFFMVLVEKEEHSPNVSTSLTIIRAVFLRISLVGVLLFSIYYRLFHKTERESYKCPEEELADVTTTCCGNPLWKTANITAAEEKGSVKCWETYVGQQFYKLAIADFFNVCLVYMGACAIRKFLWSKLKDKFWFVSKLGLAKFDLPLEVLDIVYTQTLCWVGMFFAPLLPTLCLLQTFFYFFVKKFLLLRLCEPPKANHRASRNYSFFQVVLLVTFTIICVLLGYMIGNIQPSKSCGPFRVWATPDYVMFNAVTNEVQTWPSVPKGIFNFFGTVAFFIPAFLVLGMAIYYYWAVTQGYKRLEKLLEQQVKLESYDKQYLLARVDDVIKQGLLNLH